MLDVLIFHFSLWLVLHSVCFYISFFIIISSSVSSEQTCLIISTSLFCTFTSVQQLVLVINQLLSLAHLAASALCHSTGSSSFSTVQENQDLLTFSCLLSAQFAASYLMLERIFPFLQMSHSGSDRSEVSECELMVSLASACCSWSRTLSSEIGGFQLFFFWYLLTQLFILFVLWLKPEESMRKLPLPCCTVKYNPSWALFRFILLSFSFISSLQNERSPGSPCFILHICSRDSNWWFSFQLP